MASVTELLSKVELDSTLYVELLTKLIGETERLQNNPPDLVPQEDLACQHVLAALAPYKARACFGLVALCVSTWSVFVSVSEPASVRLSIDYVCLYLYLCICVCVCICVSVSLSVVCGRCVWQLCLVCVAIVLSFCIFRLSWYLVSVSLR